MDGTLVANAIVPGSPKVPSGMVLEILRWSAIVSQSRLDKLSSFQHCEKIQEMDLPSGCTNFHGNPPPAVPQIDMIKLGVALENPHLADEMTSHGVAADSKHGKYKQQPSGEED